LSYYHLNKHQEVSDRVNRRAAGFVMNDYSPTECGTPCTPPLMVVVGH